MTQKIKAAIAALETSDKALFDFINSLIDSNSTLEAELTELKSKPSTEELEAKIVELEAKNEKNPNKDRFVDGQFTSSAKKTKGKVFTMKEGYVKTRLRSGEVVSSELLLTDEEYADEMEHLIEIGYAGIEEVSQ